MDKTLRQLQHVMFDMLIKVDQICRRNGIQYQLFSGTALGAVREHGFIPWDDDLDIIMLRSEYTRFLEVAADELGPEYYLQAEFTEHWPMFYSKLRRNGTAFIERYIPKDEQIHLGVYIDIFPCDNLHKSIVLRKLQFWGSKVVIANSLFKRGYLTDSPLKKVFMHLCRPVPVKKIWSFVCWKEGANSENVHTFFSASSKYGKNVFPREWFRQSVYLQFESGEFPVSASYDSLLRQLYGDYMIPAPYSERKYKVHAEIVDLEHSYEEYAGIQKNMKFEVLSRSIR